MDYKNWHLEEKKIFFLAFQTFYYKVRKTKYMPDSLKMSNIQQT